MRQVYSDVWLYPKLNKYISRLKFNLNYTIFILQLYSLNISINWNKGGKL